MADSTNMPWLETHLGDLENAVKAVNRYRWDLEVGQKNGMWRVTAGHKEKRVIYQSSSKEAVDAFIYGMGLAAVTIPSEVLDRLAKRGGGPIP